MKTTTADLPPARQERREQSAVPRLPYQGLFQEPAYADGKPYDTDEDPDDAPE
jgi:hypothetical protein